jgi:hypothetical protein
VNISLSGAAITLTPNLALLDSIKERGTKLASFDCRRGRFIVFRKEGPLRNRAFGGSVKAWQHREAGGLPMLPPFIIEQIRQREEKERSRREENRPRLELPLDRFPAPRGPRPEHEEDDPNRGVIILELV